MKSWYESKTTVPGRAAQARPAAFASAGAVVPPYEPEALCLVLEHSNSLRQNVDAYATR